MTFAMNIVVGVDGSDGAMAAVRYAAARAGRTGHPLELVHVLPDPASIAAGVDGSYLVTVSDMRAAGRRVLDEAARVAAAYSVAGIPRLTLIEGNPGSVLSAHSRKDRLVVLGRGRRPLLESLMPRSTIGAVAGRGQGPGIVVPESWTGDELSGRLVVGIARAAESGSLLWRAFREAAEMGASVDVVHARQLRVRGGRGGVDEDDLLSWQRGIANTLQADLAVCKQEFPSVQYRIVARNGPTDVVLSEVAQGADLMLIARRMQLTGSNSLGPTGQGLLRVAHCPIQVVAPAAEAAWERDADLESRGAALAHS